MEKEYKYLFEDFIKIIPKELIVEEYLEHNLSIRECCELFIISQAMFMRVAKYYGISKPKTQAALVAKNNTIVDDKAQVLRKQEIHTQILAARDKIKCEQTLARQVAKRTVSEVSEAYRKQLETEAINKQIIDRIVDTVTPEAFIEFYKSHNQKQTLDNYGIRNIKQLKKLLQMFNYDFSFKKGLNKGKPAVRSRESYKDGSEKSRQTQKEHWEEKSEKEKRAWAEKQSAAHNTPEFREKIVAINHTYWNGLSEEEKKAINMKKSNSAKCNWASYKPEEKQQIMANRFKDGRCYSAKDSQPNKTFAELLTKNNIEYCREFRLETKSFDFQVDQTLIEINPTISHNSTWSPFASTSNGIAKDYHKNKTEIAKKHGYNCIHLFDWDNPSKLIRLLSPSQDSIFARRCEVSEVSKLEAADFINKYHFQNYARDDIRIALKYNDEIVSIMTFGKPRYNNNYEYELIRYCSAKNVTGGAEKLFKYFLKNYSPESIVSYCDLSKFSGSTYTKLGFNLLRISNPSKHWYNIQTNEHYLDSLIRKHGFSRIVHHCSAEEDQLNSANNNDLMINAGFVEVYDCGQATYVFKRT